MNSFGMLCDININHRDLCKIEDSHGFFLSLLSFLLHSPQFVINDQENWPCTDNFYIVSGFFHFSHSISVSSSHPSIPSLLLVLLSFRLSPYRKIYGTRTKKIIMHKTDQNSSLSHVHRYIICERISSSMAENDLFDVHTEHLNKSKKKTKWSLNYAYICSLRYTFSISAAITITARLFPCDSFLFVTIAHLSLCHSLARLTVFFGCCICFIAGIVLFSCAVVRYWLPMP